VYSGWPQIPLGKDDMDPRRLPIWMLLCFLLAAPGMARADEAPPEALAFAGVWDFIGGEAEEQARIDAIEGVVAQMKRVLRGIARKRLTARTIIPQSYDIALDGEFITVATDGGDAWKTDLVGSVYDYHYDGDDFVLHRTLVGDEIHAHAEQSLGASDYHYKLSADGRTLTITVFTDSKHLPEPVKYTSTYRKR
jgi:hypothetical protein